MVIAPKECALEIELYVTIGPQGLCNDYIGTMNTNTIHSTSNLPLKPYEFDASNLYGTVWHEGQHYRIYRNAEKQQWWKYASDFVKRSNSDNIFETRNDWCYAIRYGY